MWFPLPVLCLMSAILYNGNGYNRAFKGFAYIMHQGGGFAIAPHFTWIVYIDYIRSRLQSIAE